MSEIYELCCKPGDVFFCRAPRLTPSMVRKYEVVSIIIFEDDIIYCCEHESELPFGNTDQFHEWAFKRLMYRTREEAEASTARPYWDHEIKKL